LTAKIRHLILVNYAFDLQLRDPEALLTAYFSLSEWAQACARTGCRVTVFQRFCHNHQIQHKGVDYYFIRDSLPPKPRYWQCAINFNQQIVHYINQETRSNVEFCLHINGLIFPLNVFQLNLQLASRVCYVIQHHAEKPGSRILCLLSRIANRNVDHFFFTTHAHALPWSDKKTLMLDRVVELMECSSLCEPLDKKVAREKLGLIGSPILLWTANLNANKDPVTILNGFELFLTAFPEAKLIMLYRSDELLALLNKKIQATDELTKSVKLIGTIDYSTVNEYYSAADIFVQGSASEGSGIAVLDALACGAIPVITQIPSFSALTLNGQVGSLWQIGNVQSFVESLKTVMASDLAAQQLACQNVFANHWSFDLLVSQAMTYYFDESPAH
jgi:glycosyltransferase involved in cell wall biosynthesis